MHLPITVKEIQAGYLTSPYFKNLYLCLAQNKLPSKRSSICKIETLAERCILLDLVLSKLVTMPDRETALLAVPEVCRQDHNVIPYQSLCRTSMCHKNVPDYQWQIFHCRSYALFEIIHKRVSHLSVSKNRQTHL